MISDFKSNVQHQIFKFRWVSIYLWASVYLSVLKINKKNLYDATLNVYHINPKVFTQQSLKDKIPSNKRKPKVQRDIFSYIYIYSR